MAFVPVENVARVALLFEDNGGNSAVNVIHVSTDETPITVTILNEIADVIEAWLTNSWANVSPTSWRAVGIELLDLTQEDSFYVSRVVDISGGDTVDALPSWVTIAISLRSNFSGRSRRGRLYHVGMSDDRAVGDYITEPAAAAYINCYEALRSDLLADDFEWVVVSYVSDGQPRAFGQTTPISAIVLTDRKLDRQVRRKPA